MERECRDSQRNQKDNPIFIQRVTLPEDRQMQEHNRQELAGLCQNEGQIVDMRQTGISEGRSQRRGDADEKQRKEDFTRRKDGRHFQA